MLAHVNSKFPCSKPPKHYIRKARGFGIHTQAISLYFQLVLRTQKFSHPSLSPWGLEGRGVLLLASLAVTSSGGWYRSLSQALTFLPEAPAKGFSQRTAAKLNFHFSTQHLLLPVHHLHHLHQLHLTYINFIYTTHIIYINDIVFSHLLHLHHTHHLHQRHRLQTFTSSTSHSSSTSSTGAPCLHIPRDSYNALCTGVVTQKLTSRWSTCIWTPTKLLLLKFLPTTTSNKHKPRRMKARKRETQHKRHRKRGTVTLAPAWGRGWGGARREPTLSAAPGVHPIPWSFTQPNIYIILSCWDPEKYRTPHYRTCNYRAELVKVRNMGANAIMEHNRIPTRIIERQKG